VCVCVPLRACVRACACVRRVCWEKTSAPVEALRLLRARAVVAAAEARLLAARALGVVHRHAAPADAAGQKRHGREWKEGNGNGVGRRDVREERVCEHRVCCVRC
jgi:hypothetical protein